MYKLSVYTATLQGKSTTNDATLGYWQDRDQFFWKLCWDSNKLQKHGGIFLKGGINKVKPEMWSQGGKVPGLW